MHTTTLSLLTLAAALLTSLGAHAQHRLRGRVADANGQPVAQAAVILQTVDSTYINSAVTDSLGAFAIDVTDANTRPRYRLIVQHVAYETQEQTLRGDAGECLIRLKESAQAMPEVVVRGERPIARLSGGRIIYDVPRLVAGGVVTNAYEALLRLPGVREENDAITLAGAPSLSILIDGRKMTVSGDALRAVLRAIPAEQVQSAEVMYSAPPQYHVRGAAVLIVTHGAKDAEAGWQGQVNAGYTQRHYANYALGAALSYTTAPWMARLNLSSDANHTRSGLDLDADHLYQGTRHPIEQHDRGESRSRTHLMRLETDFRLTEKSRLGMIYTAKLRTGLCADGASVGTLGSSFRHTENERPTQLHNAQLDLTIGFGLRLGTEYTRYDEHRRQRFTARTTDGRTTSDFIARDAQTIDRLRVFADQSHPLRRAGWKLNYGAEYLYATDRSMQTYRPTGAGGSTPPNARNIDSRLTERTARLYVGLEGALSPALTFSASLTGEDYRFADVRDRTLFPELSATWAIAPTHLLQASLTSDKVYPAYWENHGGTNFLNAYAEVHGNPLLRPHRTYAGRLSYILRSRYVLTLYADRMPDYSVQLPWQAPDRPALIYQSTNFDYERIMGVNVLIPIRLGAALSSRLTANTFLDDVRHSHFHDLAFHRRRVAFFSRLDNTLRLTPTLSLELNATYITPNMQGLADINTLWRMDAGLKWTFARGAAELRLKADDVFATWSPGLNTDYASQRLRMDVLSDTRAVTLSFVYRLRNYKPGKERKLDTSRFGTQ